MYKKEMSLLKKQTKNERIEKSLLATGIMLLFAYSLTLDSDVDNGTVLTFLFISGVISFLVIYLLYVALSFRKSEKLYENTFIKLENEQLYLREKYWFFYKDVYINYKDIANITFNNKKKIITFVRSTFLKYTFKNVTEDTFNEVKEFINEKTNK